MKSSPLDFGDNKINSFILPQSNRSLPVYI